MGWVKTEKTGSLNALSDVNISSPSTGEAMVYDQTSGKWINSTVSSVADLDDLTDVEIITPADGDSLIYDAANDKWVNGESSGSNDVVLTQIEYDALTPEEQNNGTNYFITDGINAPIEAASILYDNGDSGLVASDIQDAIDELSYNMLNLEFNFEDLEDVNISNIQDGQIIKYDANAQEWIPCPNVFTVQQENDCIAFDATSTVPSRYFGCKLGELDANNDTFTGLNINDINDKSFACTAYVEVSKSGVIYEVQPIACSASLMGTGGALQLRGDPVVAIERFIDDAGANYNTLTLIIFLPKSASDYYRLEIVATTNNPVLTATVTTVTSLYT